MRTMWTAAAVALVVAAGTGCGDHDAREALARVDGSALTVEDFFGLVPEQYHAVMSLEDQEETVAGWVKTELFYQEGLRQGIGDDPDIRMRLREIEREIVAEECIKRTILNVPDVTEEEAREYFDAHRNDYAIQVRLAHILVRSRSEALRALADISGGTPFETAALTVSIDQTASLGGDLGYMKRGEMIHELEEVAFSLKVGEVSYVIPSTYGYHIVKVLDRHPTAGQPSFESKRAAVMNFLTSERRRAAFDEWLEELEARAVVVIDTLLLRTAAERLMKEKEDYGYEEAPEDTIR